MHKHSAILMSIHPQYAQAIISGDKTAELRRIKPKLKNGDLVVIYETAPTKAITGVFSVKDVIWVPIELLWSKVKNKAKVSKQAFDNYFVGNEYGCAIIIDNVWSFKTNISLQEISISGKQIRPPQSYIYLQDGNLYNAVDIKRLLK